MKQLFLAGALMCLCLFTTAQVRSLELQASGLTCALCTKAINQSVEKLPFVEKVVPNIAQSSFQITIKSNQKVDIDAVRKAVEDAGFSVAKLDLLGDWSAMSIPADGHLQFGAYTLHVLNAKAGSTPGERMQVVDRKFLSDKQYKQYAKLSSQPCVRTGMTDICCKTLEGSGQSRIYHVIL